MAGKTKTKKKTQKNNEEEPSSFRWERREENPIVLLFDFFFAFAWEDLGRRFSFVLFLVFFSHFVDVASFDAIRFRRNRFVPFACLWVCVNILLCAVFLPSFTEFYRVVPSFT